MSTTRRCFTNQYKAKVALEALRGDKTIQEIAAKHQLHSNQVWASDITYTPVKYGFLYLAVIMDWATRKILSWSGNNTLHADFVPKHSRRQLRNMRNLTS